MKIFSTIVVCIALVLLVACAQFGIPTPDTFNQRLAVGYSTVTQVVKSTTTLLVAKKIQADDAANIQVQANNAKAGLDIARSLSKTDLQAADQRLTAIRTALTALQSYITLREKGK